MTQKNDVHVSSGNIFADLGLPDPEERLVKAELARKISETINSRKITQVQAAEILGIDQPKSFSINSRQTSGFSIDRLFSFLNALGNDVEILVKPKSEHCQNGRISVVC